MIVFGCIARNFFGWLFTDLYPDIWADWARQLCLSFILMRGGLQLDFSGHGIVVIFFTLLPQICEVVCGSLVINAIFHMPTYVTISNGILLSAISPGIVVPFVMLMLEGKLGTAKRIPHLMLVCCTIDNILAVKLFNIFLNLAQNSSKPIEKQREPWRLVVYNLLYTFCGGIVGYLVGLTMRCCRKFSINVKCLIMVFFAVATPVVLNVVGFPYSKYVGILFFGYGVRKQWGAENPSPQLAKIWKIVQPALFGTIGASILFRDLTVSTIGWAVLIVFANFCTRVTSAFIATTCKKLTFKERMFMAFSWMPKGTVQAALGGVVLNYSYTIEEPELQAAWTEYGKTFLTTSVFAIILTAPVGAMLIGVLSNKWLEKEVTQFEQVA